MLALRLRSSISPPTAPPFPTCFDHGIVFLRHFLMLYKLLQYQELKQVLSHVSTRRPLHFPSLKVKLQKHNTIGNGMKYKSSLHCTTRILQTEGVKGLYRGATSLFLGMAFESSLAFGIYSQMKQFLQCWCAVLPLDVAKTIIQTSTDRNHTRNPFQNLKVIYKRSGFKGCYTCLSPTIIRVFPANAAAIVTWEMAVKLLGIKHG